MCVFNAKAAAKQEEAEALNKNYIGFQRLSIGNKQFESISDIFSYSFKDE